ncbi:aminoglycoside phosphotransferase family protein [Bacillus spongiae]|uniref:Aminoglycoside phosphotransferase family protein n=1 Tax=Bacillus spongiae TaxID=2683610 RepID=A0ABU8H9K7_9BACI
MNVQEVINILIKNGIIQNGDVEVKELKGGTVSKLYLINTNHGLKVVVKQNLPEIIKAEALYLNIYQDVEFLPNLLYVEEHFHFMVYSYIDGSTNRKGLRKKEMVAELVTHLINHYKPFPNSENWGWVDEQTDSWNRFLLQRVEAAEKWVKPYLTSEDVLLVRHLVESKSRTSVSNVPYLLHGDCGIHNFIFQDGKFIGVIDPMPVLGPPLYDVIYAFCSTPDELTKSALLSTVANLLYKEGISEMELFEEMVIGLFLRISTCVKHHPTELKDYQLAWKYWKNILNNCHEV